MRLLSVFIPTFFLLSSSAQAQEITVSPYLQWGTPDSMWVLWETSSGSESTVEWGATNALGNTAEGSAKTGLSTSQIHTTKLENLSPDTRYHYRVITDQAVSPVYDFKTAPAPDSEAGFNLVAMSDMQRDGSNPLVYEELVEEGVIDFMTTEYNTDLVEALDLVLIPGDLVDNGWLRDEWTEEFFAPTAPLMAHVPIYPVLGNHEANTSYYFDFFHLPDNGDDEHWWFLDYSNTRMIGLDSNLLYRTQGQLDWLSGVLQDACTNDNIDFVFAELHHPYQSEPWIDGNTDYTGLVIGLLESFTETCDKPSVHFFGHTHAYSRGQSRDHQHLAVNVASAGGNIDYWGEYTQIDYEQFTVSQDEWGFVVVEVEAGDDPSMRLRRVSRGNEITARNNEIRDEVSIYRSNQGPAQPAGQEPTGDDLSPRCTTFKASEYTDPDFDLHGASHWQLSQECAAFDELVDEAWIQHENWFGGEDLQAGDDLTDVEMGPLQGGASYCWRVRYRDRSLAWGEWSAPVAFTTVTGTRSENLLTNPGAEDGLTGWTVTEGEVEVLAQDECGAPAPPEGDYLFAAGGICDPTTVGSAHQIVDLSSWSEAIDGEGASVIYGGTLADYNGSDIPEVGLVFYDDAGTTIGTAGPLSHTTDVWTEVVEDRLIPASTRSVSFVIKGTRTNGVDNDSYLDALFLLVDTSSNSACDQGTSKNQPDDSEDTEDPLDEGCGCETATLPRVAWGLVFLLAAPLLRRRSGALA
jgi:acid phosphatase type 7